MPALNFDVGQLGFLVLTGIASGVVWVFSTFATIKYVDAKHCEVADILKDIREELKEIRNKLWEIK